MSQSSSEAEAIAVFQADLAAAFMDFSMAALVAYEYILTINQEVVTVWQRKWTVATWVFMANRYLMIVITILNVAPWTALSCPPEFVLETVLAIVQFVVFAAFSALRAFVVSNSNIPITLLILALNLVPFATNIYASTQETVVFSSSPILGNICSVDFNVSDAIDLDLVLGTRIAVIVADILVLALIWRQTFGTWWMTHAVRLGTVQMPMSSLLLRDGTVYFITLLTLNIAQVLVNTVPALENISPVSSTISTLTPILISRALLNLRQASYTDTETYTQNAFDLRASVAGFRFPGSGLGDMGAGFENDTSEEAIQEDGNVEQSQEVDTSAHYVSTTDDVSGVQVVARDAAV